MRRLLVIASTMVLFDVAFYSAIAPLLPDYVDQLGLSKAEAGILSAAYAAGTLIASLPGRAARQPRRPAPDGARRPGAARALQRRLRLRRGDRPARRRPLQPGRRRGADLVGGADLADHRPPRRSGAGGDRHGARHRGRRRPDRSGAGAARGGDRHRGRLQRRPRDLRRLRGARLAPAGVASARSDRRSARSPPRSSPGRS